MGCFDSARLEQTVFVCRRPVARAPTESFIKFRWLGIGMRENALYCSHLRWLIRECHKNEKHCTDAFEAVKESTRTRRSDKCGYFEKFASCIIDLSMFNYLRWNTVNFEHVFQ